MLRVLTAVVVALGSMPGLAGPGVPDRSGPPSAPSDVNPLTPLDSFTVNGGFAAAASCVGDNATADGGPDGGSLQLTGVPAGATILAAWIWWTVEDHVAPIPPGSPTFDGLPVTPVAIGEVDRSPCFAQPRTAAFRADVTSLVSGDGTYVVDGLPASGGASGTFTEGVTLAVVYCDASSPVRTIVIYDGIDVVTVMFQPHTQVLDGFTVGAAPVEASFLMVAGNGQPTPAPDADPLLFNGVDLETVYPSDLVLAGSACDVSMSPMGQGWWDLGHYDVSSLVSPGDTRADVSLSVASDCYSVAAQILAVTTDEPAQGPTAVPSATSPICLGADVILDGSASSGCSGAAEYRWRDGASVVCDWSAAPTCEVSPPVTTTYTLDVRCVGFDCAIAAAPVTVEVVSPPIADAGGDARLCEGLSLTLDAGGSTDPGCPGGLEFTWYEGATVVRPAAPDPRWDAPTTPVGLSTYTVVASCAGLPGCEGSDDVEVEILPCNFAVEFDRYAARWLRRGGRTLVEVDWTTLSEDGTLGFVVERAASAAGPWAAVGDAAARGPGRYVVRDEGVRAGARPWYRVVELVASGRGDQTWPFQVGRTSSGGRQRPVR